MKTTRVAGDISKLGRFSHGGCSLAPDDSLPDLAPTQDHGNRAEEEDPDGEFDTQQDLTSLFAHLAEDTEEDADTETQVTDGSPSADRDRSPGEGFRFEEAEDIQEDDPLSLDAEPAAPQPEQWLSSELLSNEENEPSSTISDEDDAAELADLSFDFAALEPNETDDDADGVSESIQLATLPPLGEDDDQELDSELWLPLGGVTAFDDSELAAPAERRFLLLHLHEEEFECLALTPCGVVAANHRVVRPLGDELDEWCRLPSRASSLAHHQGWLWVTTVSGAWYRASLDATESVLDEPEEASLWRPRSSKPEELITLRVDQEQLLARAGEVVWDVLDPEQKGASRSPLLEHRLSQPVSDSLLANAGHLLVSLDQRAALSLRRGQNSDPVTIGGFAAASALTLGRLLKRTLIWVALCEVGDNCRIVEIEVDSLKVTTVAELELPAGVDSLDVRALAWDPSIRTLYAATNAGLFSLERLVED